MEHAGLECCEAFWAAVTQSQGKFAVTGPVGFVEFQLLAEQSPCSSSPRQCSSMFAFVLSYFSSLFPGSLAG